MITKMLFAGVLLISGLVQASPVHDWWQQCRGNFPESTCHTDSEISKFKTICSKRSYKEDCQMVVDYIVAKTRITEGKSILLSGYSSQKNNYTLNKKYMNEIEEIWEPEKIDGVYSFAVGLLPSCHSKSKTKLYFGKKLREEVKQVQDQFIKLYNSLSFIPCPDKKDGFVLVTIGKVLDSKNEFEVFTLDEKKNFKVINTSIGAGPFITKNGN